MLPYIEPGWQVFLADGADAFGAVRKLGHGDGAHLLVHVEGTGDFVLSVDDIEAVHDQKVIIHWDGLPEVMKEAIRHATDREDFPPEDPDGENEVELVPPPPTDDDPADDSWAPRWEGPRVESPPWELPGRDVGSRYGAPPSVKGRAKPR